MAFDKFPDHRFVVQAVGMDPWGYSELMIIDPSTAELLASRVTGCNGGPGNYTQFTHEARVRPRIGDVIVIKGMDSTAWGSSAGKGGILAWVAAGQPTHGHGDKIQKGGLTRTHTHQR